MKLYYSETLNPRKVCAVARHLELPIEYVHVNLARGEHKRPEFLALNPNGLVPVLQEGERTLWESAAIMCRLAEVAGSDLWPHDERQLDVLRWLSWDSQHFTRHGGTLYFEHLIKPVIGLGGPDETATEQATAAFRAGAAVLEAHLQKNEYLVGPALTVADFAVAAALPYADRAHLPIDEYPSVRRWYQPISVLPAWREPFPRG